MVWQHDQEPLPAPKERPADSLWAMHTGTPALLEGKETGARDTGWKQAHK